MSTAVVQLSAGPVIEGALMRTATLALVTAVALGACVTSAADAKETICYPPFPTVVPDHAAPGVVVAVGTAGYDDVARACGSARPVSTYGIQMRSEDEIGSGARAGDSSTNRLATVHVDGRTLAYRTEVTVPPGTRPGSYYVAYARAPTDHYHARCDGTRSRNSYAAAIVLVSCGIPAPNLSVVPRP